MKKRTRNILILLVGLVLIGCVVVLLTISEKTDDTSEIIEHKINKIRNENRAAKFSELTPFDWDKAFILEDPFYDQEKIDEIVGVNCNLNRLETDINRRIVFVNDRKFVFDYIYDVREYRYSPSGTITLNNNSTIHTEYEGSSKVIVLNVEPYCCAVLLCFVEMCTGGCFLMVLGDMARYLCDNRVQFSECVRVSNIWSQLHKSCINLYHGNLY